MKRHIPEFAEAVFIALRRRGFSSGTIAGLISASDTRFRNLESGRHEMTDHEMTLIEAAAGQTIGQLALEGAGVHDLRRVGGSHRLAGRR